MWKMALAACAVSLVLGVTSRAQVINGESTYEDNFEHDPPAASRESPPRAREGAPVRAAGEKRDAPVPPRE